MLKYYNFSRKSYLNKEPTFLYSRKEMLSDSLLTKVVFFFFIGCWVAWEAGTCLRVGVAAARWCVEVRASQDMPDQGPLEIRTMLLQYHRICRDTLQEGAERLQLAITRAAPLCRPVLNSAISCEFPFIFFTRDFYQFLRNSFFFFFFSVKWDNRVKQGDCWYYRENWKRWGR